MLLAADPWSAGFCWCGFQNGARDACRGGARPGKVRAMFRSPRLERAELVRFFPFLASLAAIFLSAAEAAEPERVHFGDRDFIEYRAGDLPLVISSPHGGREKPNDLPTRTAGVVDIDINTQELARAIEEEVLARTKRQPHLVICRLHRSKLDCNREISEAAAGSPLAEKAWGEYHGFIEKALATAIARAGRAFLIDLHGQGHKDRRIELGYLHAQETLALPDAELNAPTIAQAGSLRRIAERSKLPYVELLRGPRSLGALLEARGFPCAPSPQRPVPVLPFFAGGYTTRRHVAGDAPVAGLQIECNLQGVRDTAENRARFAAALVGTLQEWLPEHFDLALPPR